MWGGALVGRFVSQNLHAAARPPNFVMGSRKGLEDEQPEHRVRLIRGFEIGKFEVTQAQWETVMSETHPSPAATAQAELPSAAPSHFKGSRNMLAGREARTTVWHSQSNRARWAKRPQT